MGRTDSHLHPFRLGETVYGVPVPVTMSSEWRSRMHRKEAVGLQRMGLDDDKRRYALGTKG
jgi:hypothetical protein